MELFSCLSNSQPISIRSDPHPTLVYGDGYCYVRGVDCFNGVFHAVYAGVWRAVITFLKMDIHR